MLARHSGWRRSILALSVTLLLSACQTPQDGCPSKLSSADIAAGLRDLLKAGIDAVADIIGRIDGYYGDKDIRVDLPEALKRVRPALQALGGNSTLADLELKFNRAAESAAPRAEAIVMAAVDRLQFEDPEAVFRSGSKGATQYFKRRMSKPLSSDLTPVLEQTLSEVGALQAFDDLTARYAGIPLPGRVRSEMIEYVLEAALEGMFDYLGRQEGLIRSNPALRNTPALKCMFERLQGV